MSKIRIFKLTALALIASIISIVFSFVETVELIVRGQITDFFIGDYFTFFVAQVACNMLIALLLVLLFGLGSWLIFDVADKENHLKSGWKRFWSDDIAYATRLNSKLFSMIFSLLIFSASVGMLAYYAQETFHGSKLIASYLAGLSLVVLFASMLFYIVCWRVVAFVSYALAMKSRVAALIFSPRFSVPLLFAAGLALVIATMIINENALKGYDLRPHFYLSIFLALIAIAALITEGVSFRMILRLHGLPNVALVISVSLFILSHLSTAYILEKNMSVREGILNLTAYNQYVISSIKLLADLDGDGYSMLYGGGDCNEFDEEINPDAMEIPDNGIDENCIAGDYISAKYQQRDIKVYPRKNNQKPIKNVVIVIIDAVRGDMVSFNGSKKDTTPKLKEIAEKGCTVFKRGYSSGSKTSWSIAPLLFAKRSSQLQWEAGSSPIPGVSEGETSMAEVLKKRGFNNVAFSLPEYHAKYMKGIFQGFDFRDFYRWAPPAYKKDIQIPTSNYYTDEIIKWLKANKSKKKPFFIYAHYYDPHAYYVPDKDFKKFGGSSKGRYQGEILFSDFYVARLYDWMQDEGLLDDTVFIVSADHGEGLGDHHAWTHGQNLFEEQTHVPLLVCLPDTKPNVIEDRVSQIDLGVTIFNLLDTPVPEYFMGRSLVPLLDGDAMPPEVIVSEIMPDNKNRRRRTAFIKDDWKLMYNHISRSYSMYDLVNDPKEKTSLYGINKKVTQQMMPTMFKIIDEASALRGARKSKFVVAKTPKSMIPLAVEFDDGINLLGYNISKKTIRRGEKQSIKLYWTAREQIENNYRIFIHVNSKYPRNQRPKDKRGKKKDKHQFKVDHAPAHDSYPTREWRVGEIILDEFDFKIPLDTPTGDTEIWMGMWLSKRLDFKLKDKKIPSKKRSFKLIKIRVLKEVDSLIKKPKERPKLQDKIKIKDKAKFMYVPGKIPSKRNKK